MAGLEKRAFVWMIIAVVASVVVLAYTPGLIWRACAWAILAIVALVLVALGGNVLYGILSLERGYSHSALVQSATSTDVDFRQRRLQSISGNQASTAAGCSAMRRVSTTANGAPSPPRFVAAANHTFRFEDLMADLGAAEYLLCKVQASAALPDIPGAKREECDQAISRIRRLVDEITFQNGEHRLVS